MKGTKRRTADLEIVEDIFSERRFLFHYLTRGYRSDGIDKLLDSGIEDDLKKQGISLPDIFRTLIFENKVDFSVGCAYLIDAHEYVINAYGADVISLDSFRPNSRQDSPGRVIEFRQPSRERLSSFRIALNRLNEDVSVYRLERSG